MGGAPLPAGSLHTPSGDTPAGAPPLCLMSSVFWQLHRDSHREGPLHSPIYTEGRRTCVNHYKGKPCGIGEQFLQVNHVVCLHWYTCIGILALVCK